MRCIVVERSFDAPASMADMEARERAVSDCFARHRVSPVRSFLSRNGMHAVCVYDGPDAEAVRATQREAGLPFARVWAAHVMEPPERKQPPGYSQMLVPRALPEPFSMEQVAAKYEEGRDCHDNHRVFLWHSYLSEAGERMICRYFAPDMESVRIANREAELPVEAVWPVVGYGDTES